MSTKELVYKEEEKGTTLVKHREENVDLINVFGRPSLVNNVKYPISDKDERLLDAAYKHGLKDAARLARCGFFGDEDPFLKVLITRVEEIRKDKIKKGRIEPESIEERKWRLGL